MFDNWYKLNKDGSISPVKDANDFTKPEDRVIKQTYVGNKWISTVFLGYDHRMGKEGPPIVFETMVFPSREDLREEYCERYSSYQDAVNGHDKIVSNLKRKLGPTERLSRNLKLR